MADSHPARADRERDAPLAGGASHGPAPGRAAGGPGPHRHQGRLRRGGVRRLLGAPGRPAGEQLPGAGRPGPGRRACSPSRAWPGTGSCTRCSAAFLACNGAQCGFCTPGMVLAATDLLGRCPHPDEAAGARRAGRQHLPVHRLREDRGRGAGGRRPGGAGPEDAHERRRPRLPSDAPGSLDEALELLAGSPGPGGPWPEAPT